MRLHCIGDLMTDVVVRAAARARRDDERDASIHTRPGGGAANVARAYARLGGAARLIAAVGDDDWARILTERLRAEGVGLDPQRVQGPTGTVLSLVEGDARTMYAQRGANAALRPQPLGLARGDGVYLGGYLPLNPEGEATVRDALAQAGAAGARAVVDTPPATLIARIGPERFLDAYAGAEILFTTEIEAQALAQAPDARALLNRFPLIVVKRGAKGCRIVTPESAEDVPAEPLENVDPTGAGDAFCAGFLYARGRGDAPAEAARFAHGVAARFITGRL